MRDDINSADVTGDSDVDDLKLMGTEFRFW